MKRYLRFLLILFIALTAAFVVSHLFLKKPQIGSVVFSPDGQYLLFHAEQQKGRVLYQIKKDGTALTRLTPVDEDSFDARYSPDGSKIVYAKTPTGKFGEQADLFIMNVDGSDKRQITSGDTNDFGPVFSKDGDQVYFIRANWFGRHSRAVPRRWHEMDIYAVNIGNGMLKQITNKYFYTVHSLSVSPDDKELIAYIFEPDASVKVIPLNATDQEQSVKPNFKKYVANINEKPWATKPVEYDSLYDPSLSLSGKFLLFVWAGHYQGYFGHEIYKMDMKTKETEKLTDFKGELRYPSFSPDGKEIVFIQESDSKSRPNEIWIMNNDGENPRQVKIGL